MPGVVTMPDLKQQLMVSCSSLIAVANVCYTAPTLDILPPILVEPFVGIPPVSQYKPSFSPKKGHFRMRIHHVVLETDFPSKSFRKTKFYPNLSASSVSSFMHFFGPCPPVGSPILPCPFPTFLWDGSAMSSLGSTSPLCLPTCLLFTSHW